MKLYGGNDLHSTNNFIVLINEEGKVIYSKRLPNKIDTVLSELSQFEGIERKKCQVLTSYLLL